MTAKASHRTSHSKARRSSAVETVLGKLENVRRSGRGWTARCPAHEDRENSLSVGVGDDGRVLLKCFAGCEVEAIVASLRLTMQDLFDDATTPRPQGGGGASSPGPTATVQPHEGGGLTLAQYAAAKRLPVEFLTSLGLTEIYYQRKLAVRIPYLTPDGQEVAVRFRLALEGPNRFCWKSGAKPCLYGLQRLRKVREAGYVVLVEGESDCHTLWLHGIPALGLPGAATWKEQWAEHFEGIPCIYVVMEPDAGREAVAKWLGTSAIRHRVRLVELGKAKDPSDLYLQDPEAFVSHFRAALDAAVPWAQYAEAQAEERAREAWAKCEHLANQPRILGRFADEIAATGVAGEARVVKLLYLALASRLFDRPVSVVVKGPSSGGKSFLAERVLRFFPESAYHALTAMSERALAYSEEPLSHRFIVIFEQVGLQSDFASYLVRSLLSEGRVRYETVEKTSQGLRPRLIEREGPTGLLSTTTAVRLHPENETRLLSIQVNDTPAQTRSVLLAIAEEDGAQPDYATWHALHEWLEHGEHRVAVPFARDLAEAIPPVAVRLRRDFATILSLIRAHALLHRATRGRDAQGRIVASLDDYSEVRDLVADLVADGVEVTVPGTVRETVEAVTRVLAKGADQVTTAQVARELGLEKSSGYRRVQMAISGGYLRNLETRKGRPALLVLGDPLPEDRELLPSPKTLEGCTVAVTPGEEHPPPPSPRSIPSGWPEESIQAERKFGSFHARLYPFLRQKGAVSTPYGTGTLVQAFQGEAHVLLDGHERVVVLDPNEVKPRAMAEESGPAARVQAGWSAPR